MRDKFKKSSFTQLDAKPQHIKGNFIIIDIRKKYACLVPQQDETPPTILLYKC